MMGVNASGTLHDLCKDRYCEAREQSKIVQRFAGSITAQASGAVKRLCKTCFGSAQEWPA